MQMNHQSGGMRMSVPEHEAIIRRWMDAWNTKDIDTAVGLLAP
jgi:hypothetical protein